MKDRKMQWVVVYHPDILSSMAAICRRFGVGEKQVRVWLEAGAPIAVEGDGTHARYSAEAMRLQAWREGRTPGEQAPVAAGMESGKAEKP